jgi:hypothetical protein
MAMRFGKNTIRAGAAAASLFAPVWLGALGGCSAAPVKMECQEIRTRLNYSDLSEDQKRFAEDELAECEGRVKAAEAKDSTLIEGVNDRFTPKDSQ